MWELLNTPFVQLGLATAFVLAGMHAYLGFHVVSRGVIFVDLSLAQAAACGSAFALALGHDEHSTVGYLISLAFTLFGAWIISVARVRDNRVPHEAFIGIVYGAFTAVAILFLAQRAEGAEHLNHLLSGSLLTVQPRQLLKILLLYGSIGMLHWVFRRQFFERSALPLAARTASGANGKGWDFLFYASFGIVVTSSVEVAGVILVFALLVIPPVVAVLFTYRTGWRLAIGWLVGFVGALVGVLVALQFDLPVSPAIIVVLVSALLAALPALRIIKRS